MEEALINEEDINPERRDDWREVNNYVAAMNSALEELKTLPLSSRLIRNAHKVILASARGEHKSPGEFRTSQNWIGGAGPSDATFIPPLHTEVPDLMTDLERFLRNTDIKVPHLVRIAIVHYQFETIHPFLDGNGRIGRLLITLYLVSSGVLDKPMLYLSDFFEHNKSLYYDNLTGVRTKDDLGQWIRFFLTGVAETADAAVFTLQRIIKLKESIQKDRIMSLGKRTTVGMELLSQLFKRPVVAVKDVQGMTGLSAKAANDLVQAFVEKGILAEITGQQRNRLFVFHEYMKLF
jgi:Fic family protein